MLSAAAAGFYAPANCANPAVVDGATYRYFAVSDDGSEHEEGDGVWDAGTSTLTRANIRNSSNSGSAVDFGAPPTVYMGGPAAADMPGEELLGYVDFAVDGAASVVTLDADLRDYLGVKIVAYGIRMDTSVLGTDVNKALFVQFRFYDDSDTALLNMEDASFGSTYSNYYDGSGVVENAGIDIWKWLMTSSLVSATAESMSEVYIDGTLGLFPDNPNFTVRDFTNGFEVSAAPITLKVESGYFDGSDYDTPPNMISGKIWFYGRRK